MNKQSSLEPVSMNITSNNSSSPEPRLQTITRFVSEAEANAALLQIKKFKDGSIRIVRFTRFTRILHFLLLVDITAMAFTGLAQIYYSYSPGKFMLNLLGGLENSQRIHHALAILLAVLAVAHMLDILDNLFVRRQKAAMLPRLNDFRSFYQMQLVNLGLSKKQPHFDRYSFEEKSVYWLVSVGIMVLGLTGIIQWFPIQATEYLPGVAIPYAGIIHRWGAILVIFVVFIWHLYQVFVRKADHSIFTGVKSRETMLKEHSLELEYLEKAAAAAGSPTWPVKIELTLYKNLDEKTKESETTPGDEPSPKGS